MGTFSYVDLNSLSWHLQQCRNIGNSKQIANMVNIPDEGETNSAPKFRQSCFKSHVMEGAYCYQVGTHLDSVVVTEKF